MFVINHYQKQIPGFDMGCKNLNWDRKGHRKLLEILIRLKLQNLMRCSIRLVALFILV